MTSLPREDQRIPLEQWLGVPGNGHLHTNGVQTVAFTQKPRWFGRRDRAARPPSYTGTDRAVRWLRGAMIGLFVLSAGAALVSWWAQYTMIVAARGNELVSAIEAAIPDAAALVFACLGIALALHGLRALRPRALNLAAVSASVYMNYLAAGPGWRGTVIWILPPVAYALASDTMIAVIRAWTIARDKELNVAFDEDEDSPLARAARAAGMFALWLLRLCLAAPSTLAGFRGWVITEVPVAPGRTAPKALDGGGDRGHVRVWEDLTPAYRQRLEGRGITKASYEAGCVTRGKGAGS